MNGINLRRRTTLSREAASAYYATVIADSPAAYWRLDEASGNAIDSSGNGYTLTASSSGVSYQQSGIVSNDYCISLNGSTGRYTSSFSPAAIVNVSVENWVFLAVPQKGTFWHVGAGNGFSLGIGASDFDTSGSQLILVDNWIAWHPTGVTVTNGWHHYVVVMNATSHAAVYQDGSLVYTNTGSVPANTSANFAIGNCAGDNDARWWSGRLDEVAYYSAALTPTQVATHFAAR